MKSLYIYYMYTNIFALFCLKRVVRESTESLTIPASLFQTFSVSAGRSFQTNFLFRFQGRLKTIARLLHAPIGGSASASLGIYSTRRDAGPGRLLVWQQWNPLVSTRHPGFLLSGTRTYVIFSRFSSLLFGGWAGLNRPNGHLLDLWEVVGYQLGFLSGLQCFGPNQNLSSYLPISNNDIIYTTRNEGSLAS